MSQERAGSTEAKERSASRLRVEPPVPDRKPEGRWMATAGSRRPGALFARGQAKARVPLEVIETTGRQRNGAASGAMKVPHSNRVRAATKTNPNKYRPDKKHEIAEPHASRRRNACASGGVERTETGTLAWGTEVVEDRERPMSEEPTNRAHEI